MPSKCPKATAWNTNRTLCIAGKEIQEHTHWRPHRQKWLVYTPVGDSYAWDATTEHDTLEDAITAAFAG